MKTMQIAVSALAPNRNYNIGGRQIIAASFTNMATVRKAGKEGRLFVVYSTGPWTETTRVVANSPEEATVALATDRGPEWTHEVVGTIEVVPDPEWYADWAPLVDRFGGIENLDARIGQCLSQGTTAEQAWLGRALRSMGERGKEIVVEAMGNFGSRGSDWNVRIAAEVGPYCEPADRVLTTRRSELEPSAFGQPASVAPLWGIAEGIARTQVRAGIAAPFPACNPGGWKVVWKTPGDGRLVTLNGALVPAPKGLKEEVLSNDYETYLITRDVEEFGLAWARQHRASHFA